jgi:hypothetical protein
VTAVHPDDRYLFLATSQDVSPAYAAQNNSIARYTDLAELWLDGFVNVFKISDGSLVALPSTGQPIVGMAMLKGKDGKPVLAVGTKFGAHAFAADSSKAGFKKIGSQAMPVAAFAGPGGTNRDRVFVVGSSGAVSILTLK